MFKFFKNLFGKKEVVETENIIEEEEVKIDRGLIIESIDLSEVNLVKPYRKKTPNGKLKNVLLLDDYADIESIYRINLENIVTSKNKNPCKDFNIFGCFGELSARKALKVISEYHIDYAILDLTLSESVVYDEQNITIYLDGVDIAGEIYKRNPKANIIFLTAHNLNLRYDYFHNYATKFNEVSNGRNIVEHYINKINDDLVPIFLKFLYGGK